MTEAVNLTQPELVELTKRSRPTMQARVLDALGIPYRAHPDGALLVSRQVVEKWLRGEAANDDGQPFEVDVEVVRNWGNGGKEAKARQ